MSARAEPLPPLKDDDVGDPEAREQMDRLGQALRAQRRAGEGAPPPEPPPVVLEAAEERRARRNKPQRHGIQFKLPTAVNTELKVRAAREGTTATLILMEILAGRRPVGEWPITDADFVDLRREPR